MPKPKKNISNKNRVKSVAKSQNVKTKSTSKGNIIIRQINMPIAKAQKIFKAKPRIVSSSGESIRIQHSELISSSIPGSTAFTVQMFLALNPGLSYVFPWLSSLAQNFEFYKCHSLEFEFQPFVSTSTAGLLEGAYDYDPNDTLPTTEQALSNYPGFQMDSVFLDCSFKAESSGLMGGLSKKTVRSGAAPTNDLIPYDMGSFCLATNNCAGSSALGKIWVHYDIELITPVLSPSGGLSNGLGGEFNLTNWVDTSQFLTPYMIAKSGTNGIVVSGGEFKTSVASTFMILLSVQGTGLGTMTPVIPDSIGTIVEYSSVSASSTNIVKIYKWVCNGPSRLYFDVSNTTLTAGRMTFGAVPSGMS